MCSVCLQLLHLAFFVLSLLSAYILFECGFFTSMFCRNVMPSESNLRLLQIHNRDIESVRNMVIRITRSCVLFFVYNLKIRAQGLFQSLPLSESRAGLLNPFASI